MNASRIALVTGANQGLGRALAEGLAARMAPQDRVLLTGRDPGRVDAAAAAVAAARRSPASRVACSTSATATRSPALAAELGEVDIVFSNATARMTPDADPADEVDAVAETSNLATTRILRAFAPRLRPGGRLIIVASALGTLDKLDDRVAGPLRRGRRRRTSTPSTRSSPTGGRPSTMARAEDEGFGTWLNIPSKVAQVAAVRALARERRDRRPRREQADHGALPRPDRHRRLAPVVRGHEPRRRRRPRRLRGRSNSRSRRRSTPPSTASSSSSARSSRGRPGSRWPTRRPSERQDAGD